MIARWTDMANWWEAIWFKPKAPETICAVRIATGVIAAIHFLTMMFQGPEWVGPNGWLNVEAGRFLIGNAVLGTGSFYRWSILYVFPSLLPMVAGVGLMASLAMTAGIGARLSPFSAWICLTTFHHRAPLLTLVYEPLVAALLAYLTIDPGRLSWTIRPGLASGQERIGVNIVTQLIRCHLWIWIAFSLSSMLAFPVWWNGEAGWLLIQQERGWLHLPNSWQWVGQALTHTVIATQATILFCMLQSAIPLLGRWMLYLFILAMLLLLGDWMYASVLFAASLAVWPVELNHRFTQLKQK